MAFSKIVGLEVRPVMPLSTNAAIVPEDSSPRLTLSYQMDWPSSWVSLSCLATFTSDGALCCLEHRALLHGGNFVQPAVVLFALQQLR